MQPKSRCESFGNPKVKTSLPIMYSCMQYNSCREAHAWRKGSFFCHFAREKRNINPYYAWILRHMDKLCNESEII
jgi:hypothetical protein